MDKIIIKNCTNNKLSNSHTQQRMQKLWPTADPERRDEYE